jgi:prepilin-type N-terminal cleavage/methylation domain-containing protein
MTIKRLLINIRRVVGPEKGLTLVEVLVALSILGFVTTGMALTMGTIFKTSHLAVNETVSLRQVQNAGYWLTKDIQRAKLSTISTAVSGRFIDLDCYTGGSSIGASHVYYVITDGVMSRYLDSGATMRIAENIVGVGTQTAITSDNDTGTWEWVFNIAVSNGTEDSRTGTYRAIPRVQ